MIKFVECKVIDESPASSVNTVAIVKRRKKTQTTVIPKFAAAAYQVPPCPPAIRLNTLA